MIKLKNGDWINPEHVVSIECETPNEKLRFVHVKLVTRDVHSVRFADLDEAIAYRDELAAQVNTAKTADAYNRSFGQSKTPEVWRRYTTKQPPYVTGPESTSVVVQGTDIKITPEKMLATGKLEDAMNDALGEAWAEQGEPKAPTYRTDPLL